MDIWSVVLMGEPYIFLVVDYIQVKEVCISICGNFLAIYQHYLLELAWYYQSTDSVAIHLIFKGSRTARTFYDFSVGL